MTLTSRLSLFFTGSLVMVLVGFSLCLHALACARSMARPMTGFTRPSTPWRPRPRSMRRGWNGSRKNATSPSCSAPTMSRSPGW